MKYLTLCLFLAGACLLVANTAQAEELQWYIGGSLGQTSTDLDDFDQSDAEELAQLIGDFTTDGGTVDLIRASSDDSDTGWKVFGGVDINEYFAAELFYAYLGQYNQSFAADIMIGISVDAIDGTLRADADFEGDAFGAAVLAKYPFNEQFEVFAKVGVARWNVDVDATVLFEGTIGGGGPVSIRERVSDDEDGTDLMYGVGAAFTFNDNWKARVEWERFPIDAFDDDVDVDFISAGIQYNF